MINLSWLIFPKVSRVVPARGRGKDTGRRRRTRRKRGNTRRGEEEGSRRRDGEERRGRRRKGARGKKEREALRLRLTSTWSKKFGHCLELGALTLSLKQVICCLSFHRSEKETERIQIIKGPYAWGQGRQPSSTFNLKFRRNLLRVSSCGYQSPLWVTRGPWLNGQEPGWGLLPSTPQAGVHSPLPPRPLLYGEVFLMSSLSPMPWPHVDSWQTPLPRASSSVSTGPKDGPLQPLTHSPFLSHSQLGALRLGELGIENGSSGAESM